MKKRILSGMRPTGKLHLGHLVGALENWVKLQEEYDCYFMVADWHALMSEYENPSAMQDAITDNVLDWLACGISPDKACIFVQSRVPEHLELYMLLSVIMPLGLLERCPTYKEQLREVQHRDLHTYGFLGYPVLQAADILLYKAEVVPVGEDQLPHLELTRQAARKFNNLYKEGFFPEPQALLTEARRLAGLDGRKMSKSYGNTIALSEEPESVRKKVMNMFTDPARIKRTDPGHPEKCNVHGYYAVFAPERKQVVEQRCRRAEIGCTDCKKELAGVLLDVLAPIQQRRAALLKKKSAVAELLEAGRAKAAAAAEKTMGEAKRLAGLL